MVLSSTLLTQQRQLLYKVPEGKRLFPSMKLLFKLNNSCFFRYKLYYIHDGEEVVILYPIDILSSATSTIDVLCDIPSGSEIYIERTDYTGSCQFMGELVNE